MLLYSQIGIRSSHERIESMDHRFSVGSPAQIRTEVRSSRGSHAWPLHHGARLLCVPQYYLVLANKSTNLVANWASLDGIDLSKTAASFGDDTWFPHTPSFETALRFFSKHVNGSS